MRIIKAWTWSCLLAVVPCMLDCTPAEALGSREGLELAVAGTDRRGTPFRLQGSFALSGLGNGISKSISTAAAGSASALRVELPPGLYSLTLNEGLSIEQQGAAAAASVLPARVTSPNPRLVLVTRGAYARVSLGLEHAEAGEEGEIN